MGLLDGVVENVVDSALKGGSKPGAANPLGDLLGNLVNGSQARLRMGHRVSMRESFLPPGLRCCSRMAAWSASSII